MRLLLLAAATLLPAASAAQPADGSHGAPPIGRADTMPVVDPAAPAADDCPPISRYHAMRRGLRPEARQLDQLPDADHYKAAYRTMDGCVAPMIASFGVRRR